MTGITASSEVLDSSENIRGTKLGVFRQFFAATIVTLGIFGLGTVLGWSSPALPKLSDSGVFGVLTPTQKAWIGSSSMLGALSSSPFAGYGVEKFGRKPLMIILAVPFIIGWVIIPWSSIYMIYVGRFITGFCAGGFSLAAPIFISEIGENHIRGMLLSLFQLMMVLGILFVYIIGKYVTWQLLSYISCAIPAAFLAIIYFIPESPRYYLSKGKKKEAMNSLMWYRGVSDPERIENELSRVQTSVGGGESQKFQLSTLMSSSVFKPVLISLSLMVFEQISGFNAIIFYTVNIFRAAGTDLDANWSTIIVGIVQVVATIISCLLVDYVGRRVLLIFSEVVMAISLGVLGTFFYFREIHGGVSPAGFSWVPITCLIIFIVAFAQGIGPLSWTIMGEILPPNIKGPCSSIATFLVWGSAFLVTFGYEPMLELIGTYWTFWIYTICCIVGTVVVTVFVPETKGKSLEEIQSLFTNKGQGYRPAYGAAEELAEHHI